MRTRTKIFLCLAIAGVGILLLSLPLGQFWREANKALYAGILGLGSIAFGIGVGRFVFCRWEEKHPEEMRQNEIEAQDERNLAIRYRAQAVSGMILQWGIMAAAWLCILLDGPLWASLTGVLLFAGKTVIEIAAMGYYQKRL